MNQSTTARIPLITLVGPPNSGKTTLFNYLSGNNFKTVNYPGATVEYSLGKFQSKFSLKAILLDSPGIVSLIPNSPDEVVAVKSLYSHPELGPPDLIIVTVDASQLSRHLLLVSQLKKSNFRIVIALTMVDILQRKKLAIDTIKLGELFSCDVVKIDGRSGKGVDNLISKVENIFSSMNHKSTESTRANFCNDTNDLIDTFNKIEKIEAEVLINLVDPSQLPNISKANKQLRILIDPKSKIECNKIDARTLKIDRILLHRIWGLVTFFAVMTLTFTSIFWLAEPLISVVDSLFSLLSSESLKLFGYGWFGDLVANGIISGTGSILVFVPQIIILFLILGILEDTGYLARGAMLIDRPLSKIGLNGKSFVPMLSGFACAIPAMMAARTIPNKKERLLTIFILPLMSCSARLPVYALLIAYLTPPGKPWIGGFLLAGIYIFSITSSIIVASIINKFKHKIVKEEDNSSFILELPAYRRPKLSFIFVNSYMNAKIYLKKAGPIILAFSIILWFLTYFPNINPTVETNNLSSEEITQAKEIERLSTSYASDLGKLIQPVMTPLGMDWRVGVSLISAFAAREVFVSSLALIFKVTDENDTFQQSMIQSMREATIGETNQKLFTAATITGLIVFFVFAMQCLSTVAVSKKETGGWRIPLLQIIIFTSLAYLLTLITVNGLRIIGIS